MSTEDIQESVKEVWALFKETAARFKETEARFKETDARFKETDARFKETDKKIQKLAELFTGQWGKLIESLAESGILEILQSRGIKVTTLSRNIVSHKNGDNSEWDFILSNDSELVVGEVKTTMGVNDVKHFLKKLREFFYFFPAYKEYKIYGAMIGLRINKDVDKFAYRSGLFVFKIGGKGMMKILNDTKFKPKDFSSEAKISLSQS